MSRGVRVAIAGTGFIGAVHARSARLAGASLVGVAASSPESARRAPPRSAPSARSTAPRKWSPPTDVDVVHICTPNHLHVPLAEAALAAGKHVILEKPIALDAESAQAITDAGRERGPDRRRPVRLPLLPHGARGARARAHREHRPVRLIHGTLPAGLAAAPDRRQLARRGGPRRRVARLRRHRLALVRPRRVRHRPSHHAPVRAHEDRAPRARQERGARRVLRRSTATASTRAVGTEDAAIVQFETDQGAVGSTVISQISAGPQEPPVARGRRRRGGARSSARRSPRSCGSAGVSTRR